MPTVGLPSTCTHTSATTAQANLPATFNTGDLLLLVAANRTQGTVGISSVNQSYTSLVVVPSGGFNGLVLYGKIATASETAPTVTFSASDTAETQMVAVSGMQSTITGIVDASTPLATGAPTAGTIPHGAMTVPDNNCLLLSIVSQRATAWSALQLLSGWDGIIADNPSSFGSIMSMGWQSWVQGTASNIATGNVSVTGSSANSAMSILVALKSAPVATFVAEPPMRHGAIGVQMAQ